VAQRGSFRVGFDTGSERKDQETDLSEVPRKDRSEGDRVGFAPRQEDFMIPREVVRNARTVRETADLLERNPRTIRRWIAQKKIRAKKTRRGYMIPDDEILKIRREEIEGEYSKLLKEILACSRESFFGAKGRRRVKKNDALKTQRRDFVSRDLPH
jgi:excisionase family DNA binding protein